MAESTTGTTRRRPSRATSAPQEPQGPMSGQGPIPPLQTPLPNGTHQSVHVLLGRVLAEMPAVDKDQENKQQGFKFRGVDDVLNALNPLLSKYGVVVVPHAILERVTEVRTTKLGNAMYATHLVVQYRWYGPLGDYIEAVGVGEGTDSLDKATPKAMTGAYKYMLFEALSISTKEAAETDADHYSPPETIHPTLEALIRRHEALPKDLAEHLTTFARKKVWNGERVAMTELPEDWWEPYGEWITLDETRATDRARAAQDADAEQPPDAPAAPTPTDSTPDAPLAPSSIAAGNVVAPTEQPTSATTSDLSDEFLDTEDAVEWEQVAAMDRVELNRRLEYEGAMPGGKKDTLENLRLAYWQAIGGEVDDEVPFEAMPRFPCPSCKFTASSRDDLEAHMVEHHADGDPQVTTTEPATPDEHPLSDSEPEPTPVTPELVSTIKGMISKLSGGSARAYAKYRREKELPSDITKLTFDQAADLGDFLEKLPAA